MSHTDFTAFPSYTAMYPGYPGGHGAESHAAPAAASARYGAAPAAPAADAYYTPPPTHRIGGSSVARFADGRPMLGSSIGFNPAFLDEDTERLRQADKPMLHAGFYDSAEVAEAKRREGVAQHEVAVALGANAPLSAVMAANNRVVPITADFVSAKLRHGRGSSFREHSSDVLMGRYNSRRPRATGAAFRLNASNAMFATVEAAEYGEMYYSTPSFLTKV